MSEFGDRLIESAEQALAFVRGEADPKKYRVNIPHEIDVKRIREKLGMSQKRFAETYGFSLRTVQEWEQGRMVPSGPARTFLVVLDREPEAVGRALMSQTAE